MERMIMESLTYILESRGMSPDQSEFRKCSGTMDPVLCLESVIWKVQANKEVVVAVFL
jgi:hypothetical protein